MRSIMRFLILGVIVFGGLLGEIQPARADDSLSRGNYLGVIDMSIRSMASQRISAGGLSYTGNVTINWFGHGYVNLTIDNTKNGTVRISYLPVDIFDFSVFELTGKFDCFASVGIKAQGLFANMGLGSTNFDAEQRVGTVNIIFSGLLGHEIVYDTVQGCPLKSMSEAQLTALEQTSNQIKSITLKVEKFDDNTIRGTCDLPEWKGSDSISNGSYAHIVDSCDWWVSKEGGDEWKNK